MRPYQTRRQRGAVLIVALLFLVMLTLLGVTAMSSTTLEERMAGNARDNSVAFQAAEAALRDARRDLDCYPNPTGCSASHPKRTLSSNWALTRLNYGNNGVDGTCNTSNNALYQGLCQPNPYVGQPNAVLPSVPVAYSFTAPPSVPYGQFTGAPVLQGVSQQPRYLIELFCLVGLTSSIGAASGDQCNFLRITAVGFGASPLTSVTLQEILVKEDI